MTTITTEQIIDLAEGRLPPSEAAELRARIATDPVAQAELQEFEALVSLMRDDESVDAPEHVIARALRLMQPPTPAPQGAIVRRFIATLLGDSWQKPLAFGLRSDPTSLQSLIYRAEDYDLDLQVLPRAGQWHLRGQVLGPEIDGSVTLQGVDRTINVHVSLNELGEFQFPPVDAGVYSLLISLRTCEIAIERLELSPSTPSI